MQKLANPNIVKPEGYRIVDMGPNDTTIAMYDHKGQKTWPKWEPHPKILKRITHTAREAFDRLPPSTQHVICEAIAEHPTMELTSEFELADAYLNWLGIIGFTRQIASMFAVLNHTKEV